MHQPPIVRLRERVAGLAENVNHTVGRERAVAAHQRLEVEPVEQLHGEVEGPRAGLAEVVEPDRVGGFEERRGLRLPAKPLDDRGGRGPVGRPHQLGIDQFDGRRPGQHPVGRPPDLPHPAAADQLLQPIAPQLARALHVAAELGHDPRWRDRDERADIIRQVIPQNGCDTRDRDPAPMRDQNAHRVHGRRQQGSNQGFSWGIRDEHGEHEYQDADPGEPPRKQPLRLPLVHHPHPERQEHLVSEREVEGQARIAGEPPGVARQGDRAGDAQHCHDIRRAAPGNQVAHREVQERRDHIVHQQADAEQPGPDPREDPQALGGLPEQIVG